MIDGEHYHLSVKICGEQVYIDGATTTDRSHIDFMRAMYRFLSNDETSVVSIDGWDSGFHVTFLFGDSCNTKEQVTILDKIVDDKTFVMEECRVKSYETTVYALAKEIIQDVESDLKKWIYFDFRKEHYNNNFDDFLKKYYKPEEIKKIKTRIKENEKLTKYWLKKLKGIVKKVRPQYENN
jgi:hypothetical protein